MGKRCLADDGYWKRKPCNKECVNYDTCIYRINKDKAEEKLKELQETEEYYKTSNRHDQGELQIMQGYSLERKIQLTCERIIAWHEWWEGKIAVSFSGGIDSTVLGHLTRVVCGLTDVPFVFVDTGLEYPEIREFVKTFDNVTILKPKLTFKQVIQKYGYPFFSKETSEAIYFARKYLTELEKRESTLTDRQTDRQTIDGFFAMADFVGIDRRANKDSELYKDLKTGNIPSEELKIRVKQLLSIEGNYGAQYDKSRYGFMLDAPFEVHNACCKVMKKAPAHKYVNETGRYFMTGQMAEESRLRKSQWVKNGCNGFYMKYPISNPMAFWTRQDVLEYIHKYNIPICSVYGDIVEDTSGTDEVEGQLTFSDLEGFENYTDYDAEKPKLKTTGCDRTGCMFCGYGCHLEKEGEGRFLKMKETHPKQYEYIMKPTSEGGLGYKEIIDWINEKGNMRIEY